MVKALTPKALELVAAAMAQAYEDHDREAHGVTEALPADACLGDVARRTMAYLVAVGWVVSAPPIRAPGRTERIQ